MAKNPQERTIVEPSKSVMKRIDIGLVTGLSALLISFVGVVTSRSSFKMAQQTQKARVLPIIDIDMGYIKREDKDYFEVQLHNVGAGIAYIQSVTPTQHGAPITDFETFDNAIMTGRMRSWATLTEAPAAGYLRAGERITPASYRIAGTASELGAYLRGEFGTPLDGLDLNVCYCSVFEDCWTVSYVNRERPQPVNSCGVSDAPADTFQTYITQRASARQTQ